MTKNTTTCPENKLKRNLISHWSVLFKYKVIVRPKSTNSKLQLSLVEWYYTIKLNSMWYIEKISERTRPIVSNYCIDHC